MTAESGHIIHAYRRPVDEVLAALGANAQLGLSDAEAQGGSARPDRDSPASLDGAALVDERRIAGDHEELAKVGQCRDDVFDRAIGKVLLLGIAP
jgi:hypothetical protein